MNRMKSVVCLAILARFGSVLPAHAAETETHLFILSGQSNMAGLDPNSSFTPTVEAAFGKENITVVKDAQSGQPIRRWYKQWKPAQGDEPKATGDLYDRLMKKVNAAIQGKEVTTVTFVWMQGEKDAREEHGEVYAASMKGLLKQLSGDSGREDINFVLGRLSDFDMDNAKYPHWTMVRNALVEVAEAELRGAWVNTDDLNDGINMKGKDVVNDLHYTVKGYEEFGRRLAEKSIELIRNTTQSMDQANGEAEESVVEEHPVIRLWTIEQVGGEQNRLKEEVTNRGKIRYENVKDPTLVVYQVQCDKPTPALIYCPGGAYKHLTPGPRLIEWLNDSGITVLMLKYTVPDDREAAFRDLQRAMRVVRYNAEKWNINPDQLGVLGSSAGGHLVARLSQNYSTPAYAAFDDADRASCEPAFVILTWAAYLLEDGSEADLAKEFHMKNSVAPTFLVYAKDDKFSTGGIVYEKTLKATGTSTHLKLYEKGGHGLKDVDWYPVCGEWLKELGIVTVEKK